MVMPCAYLGPIAYYERLLQGKTIEVEVWESFPKRTYRNRCCIAGVNGTQLLTIPVAKCDSKQLTKDVRITYQTPWQHQHWMAMKSAYENTPYFMYYEEYLKPFYEKPWERLLDFTLGMQNEIMRLLYLPQTNPIQTTLTAQWQGKELEGVWEKDANEYTEYYQMFSQKWGFQKNLSIIDLLFNMGPESIQLLTKNKD